MRLISQDGSIDIPYENFVFGITNDNYIIATRDTIASPSEIVHGVVAKYSAKEKAEKVMGMLREKYVQIFIFKATYQPGLFEHLVNVGGMEEVKKAVSPTFRFPKDDEVEA